MRHWKDEKIVYADGKLGLFVVDFATGKIDTYVKVCILRFRIHKPSFFVKDLFGAMGKYVS